MCFTNLVGFGMGIKTFTFFLQKVFESLAGFIDFGLIISTLTLIVVLMFHIRENEDDPDKGF